MATRFYFSPWTYDSSKDPSMPGTSSYWNDASNWRAGKLTRTPQGTAPLDSEYTLWVANKTVTTNPYNMLMGRFLTEKLPAGTIANGTRFRFVVPYLGQSPNNLASFPTVVVRLFSSEMILKATLYSGTTETSTVPGGNSNNRQYASYVNGAIPTRRFEQTFTAGATVAAGDRIMVELGVRFVHSNATGSQSRVFLSADETAQDDMPFVHEFLAKPAATSPFLPYRTWIEFDTNLLSYNMTVGAVKFTDTGWVLNESSTLPFVDVDSIDGIDAAPVQSSMTDRQGGHGGYGSSTWEGPRTITIAGTMYSAPGSLDTNLQGLKANYAPTPGNRPLYIGTDQGTAVFFGRSQGLRYSIDKSRGYGVVKFQVQIVCQDPRKYIDNPQILQPGSNSFTTIDIPGDRDVPTKIRLQHTGATAARPFKIIIENDSGRLSISNAIGFGLNPQEELIIDTDKRTAILNGETNVRGNLTVVSWGSLAAGTNIINIGDTTEVRYRFDYLPAWW